MYRKIKGLIVNSLKILACILFLKCLTYHNEPKFSDRYAWVNSADPDQTARSGSALFAIPSASFGLITLW